MTDSERAEKSFELRLKDAPKHTKSALIWVYDSLGMCKRMLVAEDLPATSEAVIELLKLVSSREAYESMAERHVGDE